MAVKAFERAEFVTRQAWRNTGHVHLGLTVLAARALQHAKGDTGPWPGHFPAFKNGPLVNIDQRK
jgi:hypothetical protein